MPFSWKLASGTVTRSAYGIEHASRNGPKGFSSPADAVLMELDHTELCWRARSVALGSRLTLAAIAAAGAYVAAGSAAPHRGLLASLVGSAAALAALPIAVGADRIARSAHREP